MKKLTIIITNMASKNPISELLKSLDSVKDMNAEVIVVDDSGADKIPQDYYKEVLDRISDLVINDVNLGTFAARYEGFMNATGEYIQHLDAGDEIVFRKSKRKAFYEMLNDDRKFFHIPQTLPYYIAKGDHKMDMRVMLAYATSNANTALTMTIVHRSLLEAAYQQMEEVGYRYNLPHLTQDEDFLLMQLMIHSGLVESVTTLPSGIIQYSYNGIQGSMPRKLDETTLRKYKVQEETIKEILNKSIPNELLLELCLDRTTRWFEHLNLED